MQKKARILVCTNPEYWDAVIFSFLAETFELLFVKDVKTCFEQKERLPCRLILLDPDENGRRLCRELKQDLHLSYLPVVFLAFDSFSTQTIVDCFHAGGCDYFNFELEEELCVARIQAKIRMSTRFASLVKLVTTDFLTNLCSRRYLFDALKSLFLNFDKQQLSSIGCLMIDIDNLKQVNDTRGHAAGDEALIKVSHTIRSSVREGDFVARIGGDEIAVICPNATIEGLEMLAERIRATVDDEVPIVTTSIGVSITIFPVACREEEVDWFVDDLLVRADRALYQAKESGRNRFRVFGAGAKIEDGDEDEMDTDVL